MPAPLTAASFSRRLVSETGAAVAPAGFERVRGHPTFVRRNEDTIELLNLQRSSYSVAFYLNYGIWLRCLGRPAALREELFHVRLRGDEFMRSKRKLQARLTMESGQDEGLGSLLAREFLPFAERGRSLVGVRGALRRGLLSDALIVVEARRRLTARATPRIIGSRESRAAAARALDTRRG